MIAHRTLCASGAHSRRVQLLSSLHARHCWAPGSCSAIRSRGIGSAAVVHGPAVRQGAHDQLQTRSLITRAMASNGAADGGRSLVAELRKHMEQADNGKGVQAYIIPSEDPHMSEYTPDCFARRMFISKFTGSAGTAVVTTDQALLWTDGRYFLQAAAELGPEWTLMKGGTGEVLELPDWLAEALPAGARVGIDPFCHTVDSVRTLVNKLEAAGKTLVPLVTDGNLVDKVWGEERPPLPAGPLRPHPSEWCGSTVKDKLAMLRGKLAEAKADAGVVTMLDEVAWLTNCRGGDVSYNPVFVAYALVTKDAAQLYTDPVKVNDTVKAHLADAGVTVKPYTDMLGDVKAAAAAGGKVALDPSKVSYAVFQAAAESAGQAGGARGKKRDARGGKKAAGAAPATSAESEVVVELASPIIAAKALKNPAELAGMREAHLRDAVAVCDFLAWMEGQMAEGKVVSEVEVDAQLTGRRRQQAGFVEPSFATIAGANGNGAIIHYRAQPDTCKSVDNSSMLLLDSGGQYDCGTTDITRTMHYGTPTPHQCACYTRVLQGHIGLDRVVFPEGTPGAAIDCLARLPLWKQGLNYRHGTGHGVGAGLNVHEGPQSISTRYYIETPLAAGMVCSNEPGYYEDGKFGVRIENLVVVEEKNTEYRFGGISYLGFTPLTLVPIQTKMMDLSLLKPEEVAWVDAYHAQVWEAVSPRLGDKPQLLQWLRTNTRPLAEQKAAPGAGAAAADKVLVA